jgi:uncharacterized protein YpiB (UPF0302 family)
MRHLNNEQKKELAITSANNDVSMYEKEAEMILLKSRFSFQKTQLMKQIDNTLLNQDKSLFMELTQQYKELLTQINNLD